MPDPVLNKYAPRQIPVAKPSITQAEVQAVAAAVSSGWISQGREVAEFEREFAEAHGQLFGVACNSGTTALHLALAALDIQTYYDRVIIPTLTMVAVGNTVRYCGGAPLFVDSRPEDGNVGDISTEVLTSIGKNDKIKAAISVHTYGIPAEFVKAMCPIHIPLIEDCAEAHFASYSDGSPVGSRGELACFSFYANKVISTLGEGGMVITSDFALAEKMRSLRAHAFTPGEHFSHQGLAYGYRMSDPAAAFGRAQHARRESLLAARRKIAGDYMARLETLDWLEFPVSTAGTTWWVFPVLLKKGAPVSRDRLRHWLAAAGIDTRTYFYPLHRQPHLKQFSAGEDAYPVADDLSRRGLYLPLFPDLTESDVGYICDRIRSIR